MIIKAMEGLSQMQMAGKSSSVYQEAALTLSPFLLAKLFRMSPEYQNDALLNAMSGVIMIMLRRTLLKNLRT
jgi:hypothetical protein